jgi:hypothetical protein
VIGDGAEWIRHLADLHFPGAMFASEQRTC